MEEVFIISTGDIVQSKTAGSQRIMNVAKSLAAGAVNVFICSYSQINGNHIESCKLDSGIFYLKSLNGMEFKFLHLLNFLSSVNKFIKGRESDRVIYLYPTVFVMKDFLYFVYFKIFKKYRFYCDINELRVTNASPISSSERILAKFFSSLKSVYDYIAYKLSEFQVPFYDGIVVISTSLERYYIKYTRKILRIPILCDVSKIANRSPTMKFDNTVFRICFAGSINCRKEGFDILFEALCHVTKKKEVELYLYGILLEKDRKELVRLTEKFMLDKKVFYVGNVEPDELLLEFPKYNLLIIPRPLISQTKYGFSTKLSEYMISGVPVLITDVSDNSVYIKDNYNGFIIPPGSSNRMAEKLMDIIDKYNENASVVAGNAITTAREVFDYKLYSQDFIRFFFINK